MFDHLIQYTEIGRIKDAEWKFRTNNKTVELDRTTEPERTTTYGGLASLLSTKVLMIIGVALDTSSFQGTCMSICSWRSFAIAHTAAVVSISSLTGWYFCKSPTSNGWQPRAETISDAPFLESTERKLIGLKGIVTWCSPEPCGIGLIRRKATRMDAN